MLQFICGCFCQLACLFACLLILFVPFFFVFPVVNANCRLGGRCKMSELGWGFLLFVFGGGRGRCWGGGGGGTVPVIHKHVAGTFSNQQATSFLMEISPSVDTTPQYTMNHLFICLCVVGCLCRVFHQDRGLVLLVWRSVHLSAAWPSVFPS